jgi:HD-like signal output (HDOD) protein
VTPDARRRRILFVDDEPQILEGLRDALRGRRREWRVTVAGSGDAALAELARERHDVVISDLQMPGMDGGTLLAQVRDLQPDTVRILLSAHAAVEAVARAAPAAHRLLAKPCDVAELTRVIERSCALIDLSSEHELRRTAAGAAALPTVPLIYRELTQLLADPAAGPRDAAALVERDTAITGRVLQLANSGYFGLSRPVTRLAQAVALLGITTLRSLILSIQALGAFRSPPAIDGFSVAEVQRRGAAAARLVAHLLPAGDARDAAVTAGLLHGIGLLVLAGEDPGYLADALAEARREGRPLADVEYERRGVSHAEIGAHLLALWDLPHDVLDAVAFLRRPLAVAGPAPAPLVALHVACTLLHDPGHETPWPDAGELATLGIADRLTGARAIADAP